MNDETSSKELESLTHRRWAASNFALVIGGMLVCHSWWEFAAGANSSATLALVLGILNIALGCWGSFAKEDS